MRIGPLRIITIEDLNMTLWQWRDCSTCTRPLFKHEYHFIDVLEENHDGQRIVGFEFWFGLKQLWPATKHALKLLFRRNK